MRKSDTYTGSENFIVYSTLVAGNSEFTIIWNGNQFVTVKITVV